MEEILSLNGLISFLSLALMEIVLGIDNILFISIISDRLPAEQQAKARTIGLGLALFIRIALLVVLAGIIKHSESALFSVGEFDVSLRDIILIAGGLFLLYKSTTEIHEKLEGSEHETKVVKKLSLRNAIIQIIILDAVFSFDSILTAIGLVKHVEIMIAAVIVSIGVMLLAAKTISDFINQHPTLKMLALSFLLMIGLLLVVDGLHVEVPKGYVYFAIFFSLAVELLNMKMRKKQVPVNLKQKYKPAALPDKDILKE